MRLNSRIPQAKEAAAVAAQGLPELGVEGVEGEEERALVTKDLKDTE